MEEKNQPPAKLLHAPKKNSPKKSRSKPLSLLHGCQSSTLQNSNRFLLGFPLKPSPKS
jgi:hypothetical protein